MNFSNVAQNFLQMISLAAASFLIPTILHMYNTVCESSKTVECKQPLAVVLAPTRELAMQIEDQTKQLMKGEYPFQYQISQLQLGTNGLGMNMIYILCKQIIPGSHACVAYAKGVISSTSTLLDLLKVLDEQQGRIRVKEQSFPLFINAVNLTLSFVTPSFISKHYEIPTPCANYAFPDCCLFHLRS